MRRLVGLLLLGAPGCIPHDVRTTYDEELDSSEAEEADSSEPQSQNTAQSWPRPTPVAARQDAEEGKAVVKLELPLGNKSMLKLWASPEQGGETVELMLIRAEDEPGLTSCGLEVMVNGERLATPAAKALRKGRVSALASKIGAELVRELGAARQMALRACANRWSLDGAQLQQVHRFVSLYEEELAWLGGAKKGTTGGLLAPSGGWPEWTTQGAAPQPASGGALDAQALFERLAPSVLLVETLGGSVTRQGSGVAISRTEIVTNCHVLEGARKIIVKQAKKEWVAAIDRADPKADRCVLAISEPVLKPVAGVRSYVDLKVGEPLYTLGSPSGLELSMANGILSGLREDQGTRLIQTTAPISPGSSGGGLFDARGNLVGVTTLVLAGKERLNQSLNFAIPAEDFWKRGE